MDWEKFPRTYNAPSCAKQWPVRLLFLHMRNMLHAFTRAEAHDQKSIRDLAYSVLHRDNGLLTRCMAWADRKIQRETHWRRTISLLRTDGKMTNCTEILKLPLDGRRIIVDTWIARINISDTGTRSERSRYDNNLMVGVNDQRPKPGPIKHRPDFSRAVHTLAAWQHQKRKTNPYIPKHLRERQRPIEERYWNVNRKVGFGASIGHIILPLLRQHGGVHRNDKNCKDSEYGKK